MAQVGNTQNRLGGQYMIQDSDHQAETTQPADQATRKVQQVEQSQTSGHQQGGNQSRQDRRRQAE